MVMGDANSMGRLDFDGGNSGPRWTPANGGPLPAGWMVGGPVLIAPYVTGDRTPDVTVLTAVLPDLGYSVPGQPRHFTEIVRMDAGITVNQAARIMWMRPGFDQIGQVAPDIPGCPCPSLINNVRINDSGAVPALGFYPIHFHRVGNNVRGTTVTDSLVVNGRNHAFVTHAAHGVTYLRSGAVDPAGDAFFWDVTDGVNGQPDPSSATNDVSYLQTFVLGQRPSALGLGAEPREVTAYLAAHGIGNVNVGSWVAGSQLGGVPNASGVHWSGKANSLLKRWVWDDFTVHNSNSHGVFVWMNSTGTSGANAQTVNRMVVVDVDGAALALGAYSWNSKPFHFVDGVFDADVEIHTQGTNVASEDHGTVENSYIRRLLIARHNAPGRYESATVHPSFEVVDSEVADGVVINEHFGGPNSQRGTGRLSGVTVGGDPIQRSDITVTYQEPGGRWLVANAPWPSQVTRFQVP